MLFRDLTDSAFRFVVILAGLLLAYHAAPVLLEWAR